jgi:hypothetical protein
MRKAMIDDDRKHPILPFNEMLYYGILVLRFDAVHGRLSSKQMELMMLDGRDINLFVDRGEKILSM